MVMPILTKKWKNKIPATQYPYALAKRVRCRSAKKTTLDMSPSKRRTTAALPTKPCSSPMVQKIKSECCSGTKLNLVWVPSRNPFPQSRPEPIAILDWVTFQPMPVGSSFGSTSTLIRFRWWVWSTLLTKNSTLVVKNIIRPKITTRLIAVFLLRSYRGMMK